MDRTDRQSFDAWLRQPDNYRQIRQMAAGMYRKLRMKYLSVPGLNLNLSDGPVEDIAQELLAYLSGDPSLMTGLMAGDPHILVKINRYFINHVIDRGRGKHDNQDIYRNRWRLFYRHARETLDRSGLFLKYRDPRGPVMFALADQEPRVILLPEDLPEVPFPGDMTADFQQVNTRQNILRLASHYWNACAEYSGEPGIRISARTFTEWVNRYVGLDIQIDPASPAVPGKTDNGQTRGAADRTACQPADIMKQRYLSTWAHNFSATLSGREKQVFYYFECLGMKGRDISVKLGRKSNLNYHKKKIRDRLKEFLAPLEWISPDLAGNPDRRDSTDFLFFIHALCERLSGLIDPCQADHGL